MLYKNLNERDKNIVKDINKALNPNIKETEVYFWYGEINTYLMAYLTKKYKIINKSEIKEVHRRRDYMDTYKPEMCYKYEIRRK